MINHSNQQDSCEEVDSDDITGALDLSDEDQDHQTLHSYNRQAHKIYKQRRRAKGKEPKATSYKMEVDTNIFEIRYTLSGANHTHTEVIESTRSAIFCESCSAIFNAESKLKRLDQTRNLWTCEFCGTVNEIYL